MSALLQNWPIFYAYETASSLLFTANIPTKLPRSIVVIDSCKWWDVAKARYMPQYPGVYEVFMSHFHYTVVASAVVSADIYKNGAQFRAVNSSPGANCNHVATNHTLIQMNGSTDYLEFYAVSTSTYTSGSAAASTNNSWITLVDPWIDISNGPWENAGVQNYS